MRLRAALIAPLALALWAAPAAAQDYPKFTGFVVDAADAIPDAEEAQLAQKLDGLQRRTGRQLVVATVATLDGRDIAEYGVGLIRAWGVGLKDVNNGAILIVAPGERKVRVEVGQGLEPVLTDAFSSQVIRRDILPPFRAGNLPQGIAAGTDALVAQLSLPDDEALAKVREAMKEQGRESGEARGGRGFPLPLVFWGIVALFVLLSMFRGGGGGGGGRRFRSRDGSSVWVWGPIVADVLGEAARGSRGGGGGFGGFGGGGGSSGGGWMGGGFGGGGGGSGGGGGASGSW